MHCIERGLKTAGVLEQGEPLLRNPDIPEQRSLWDAGGHLGSFYV